MSAWFRLFNRELTEIHAELKAESRRRGFTIAPSPKLGGNFSHGGRFIYQDSVMPRTADLKELLDSGVYWR